MPDPGTGYLVLFLMRKLQTHVDKFNIVREAKQLFFELQFQDGLKNDIDGVFIF